MDEVSASKPRALEPDVLGELDVRQLVIRSSRPDENPPNGSSIAFLAEYDGRSDNGKKKSAIFTGDAFAAVLEDSLRSLLHSRGARRMRIDAFKVPHHGSKRNTSLGLLDLICCRHFLVSTNGNRHCHPDAETVARILTSQQNQVDLHFNYETDFNRIWRSPILEQEYRYTTHYPRPGEEGLRVEI